MPMIRARQSGLGSPVVFAHARRLGAGFTLVEAVIVITITGILAGAVAVFLQKPVAAYIDVARRAELTATADIALRRMVRDLRLALPNSVRSVAADAACLEFLPTIDGGLYRTGTPGNVFDTGVPLAALDVLGPLRAAPAVGDLLVIYNLGIPDADAYNGDNVGTVASGSTPSQIVLSPSKQFLLASPGRRFQLVSGAEQAVFYVCSNVGTNAAGDGTGTLYRMAGYGINPAPPSVCPAIPPNTPIVAQNISACNFTYASGIAERSALVSMRLAITKKAESVSFYQDVHVSNLP
ncbi:MAG: type II secretion system protein [Massilia sp.]|nr:type II secretion system protein [Massilia sp.]